MTEHDSSTWGPHMHARRIHHRLRPPQSTFTISSGHHTLEHRRPHVRTASLITIATVAFDVRTTSSTRMGRHPHVRMRPAWGQVYVQNSHNFEEWGGTKPTRAQQPRTIAMRMMM
jgi:hypothetical protein